MNEPNLITEPDELKTALERLGLNRYTFAETLTTKGQPTTAQAVWKWLEGKTQRVPGYVGYFLFKEYGISKSTLSS